MAGCPLLATAPSCPFFFANMTISSCPFGFDHRSSVAQQIKTETLLTKMISFLLLLTRSWSQAPHQRISFKRNRNICNVEFFERFAKPMRKSTVDLCNCFTSRPSERSGSAQARLNRNDTRNARIQNRTPKRCLSQSRMAKHNHTIKNSKQVLGNAGQSKAPTANNTPTTTTTAIDRIPEAR